MGTHLGNEGTVKIGANTLAEVKSWQLSTSVQIADDSAIADAWDTHLVGSKSWTGSVTCSWDETDANGQNTAIEGASVTLNLYPEGSDSGDYYYSGTATVTEVSYQGARNGVIEASFSFTGNGALARSTV